MGCCLIVGILAASPRLILFGMWILTDYLTRAGIPFVWGLIDGAPLQRRPRRGSDIPSQSPESVTMSAELKRRGFRFVGPTVCYAFMQAVGIVNDHERGCFRSHP